MGLCGKVILMLACAVGMACTIGAIITYRDTIEANSKSEAQKAAIGCLFITFLILAGALVFIFITLCCPCSDRVMGIIIAVAGTAASLFAVAAYASFHKPEIDYRYSLPMVGEWLFGGIVGSVALLMVSIMMAVN